MAVYFTGVVLTQLIRHIIIKLYRNKQNEQEGLKITQIDGKNVEPIDQEDVTKAWETFKRLDLI